MVQEAHIILNWFNLSYFFVKRFSRSFIELRLKAHCTRVSSMVDLQYQGINTMVAVRKWRRTSLLALLREVQFLGHCGFVFLFP